MVLQIHTSLHTRVANYNSHIKQRTALSLPIMASYVPIIPSLSQPSKQATGLENSCYIITPNKISGRVLNCQVFEEGRLPQDNYHKQASQTSPQSTAQVDMLMISGVYAAQEALKGIRLWQILSRSDQSMKILNQHTACSLLVDWGTWQCGQMQRTSD